VSHHSKHVWACTWLLTEAVLEKKRILPGVLSPSALLLLADVRVLLWLLNRLTGPTALFFVWDTWTRQHAFRA
jgi:hypothetical protein